MRIIAVVHSSLQELADFIKLHDKGLGVNVNDGDYDSLVNVMSHLGAVREKQPTYDMMSYGQEINDDVYDRLNSLPEKWANYEETCPECQTTSGTLADQ